MTRDVCEHFVPVDLPCAKCEKPPTIRDDIIKMAAQAGFVIDEAAQQHQPNCIFHTWHMIDEGLTRFASIVAAAEREACATVCMAVSSDITRLGTAAECVNSIRARGNT